MKDEIKEILEKFDRILENYELDKKWGELSVDSICHLFPNELITIKNYITKLEEYYNDNINKYEELIEKYSNLQEENKRLKELDENYPIEEQLEEALKYENIYKSRIDKAIEYIKKEYDENIVICDQYDMPITPQDLYDDLINILQGEDNENKQ